MVIYSVVVTKFSDTEGVQTEIISSHKNRDNAVKVLAEEKAKIKESWGCTDDEENEDEEGGSYVIEDDIDGYFMIHDEDGMIQDEVCIDENELLD